VVVAARRQLEDPNNEAQYGDRIPYVIARGAPHERLVDRAVAPEELFDGFVSEYVDLQILTTFFQRKAARWVLLYLKGANPAVRAYIQPCWC